MSSISLALSLRSSLLSGSADASIRRLFDAGEEGVWYDPSDITTLFQTNSTPVTAAGQAVGVMLDKSKGLTLGPQLVTNGTFDTNTNSWTSVNGAVATAVDGKMQVLNNTTVNGNMYQEVTTVVGKTYLLTGQISDVTGGIQPRLMVGTGISSGDLVSSQYSGSGTFNVRAVFVATGTTTWINAIMNTATSGVFASFDGISVQEVPGNHAFQSTAGSRPTYQIDGTGRPYLSFDGVDDGLATGTLTTGTSTLQVFSGLRKLSDAAVGLVAELGTSIPNGAFYLAAPNTVGTGTYGFSSRGTSQVTFTTTAIYPAPITSVVTGIADITAPSVSVRYNGSSLGTVSTTQGTGPYSNLPLNIGRRGNGTVPYNGYLYGLIVRFGPSLSAATINATETWMNSKTGAY